ncbi:MAG: LysR family transcriptional regulator [Lachnospiraceae bacterium]
MDKGIEYILEVARCGGITKAANNLYITPSALSKYVQSKEDEMDVKLFHRVGKKFVLTQAGECYVEKCKQIEKIQYELSLQMKSFSEVKNGEIRIGAQHSLIDAMIKHIVPKFKEEFPGMNILLLEYSVGNLMNMLKAGQLDVIVSTIDKRDPTLQNVKVCDCELVLAVNKENPIIQFAYQREGFKYPWIHLEHCVSQPHVMLLPGSDYRVYAEHLYQYYGLKPQVAYQLSSTRMGITSVANDFGVMLTLDKMVQNHLEHDKVEILSVGEWPLRKELSIMYYEKTLMLDEVKRFIEIVCDKI